MVPANVWDRELEEPWRTGLPEETKTTPAVGREAEVPRTS